MNKQSIKRKILSEKGGAAVLVFFTVFTFLVVLSSAYFSITVLRKSQLKSNSQIQGVYEEDFKNVDDVYNDIANFAPYDKPYIPKGFERTEGTWNSGYTIKETETGNEFVWVPCVLDKTKVRLDDNVEIFKKTTEGMYNSSLLELSPTVTSITDEKPTEEIRKSVGKYGGFYIAKYEAGVPVDANGKEVSTTLATSSQKARSVSGATVWTDIRRIDAMTAAENMIDFATGVKSGLISGECWDTTLQWMVNTSDNASKNKDYDIDSIGKGWYSQTSKTVTGQYKVNNIYDMGGNLWEWTTENTLNNGVNYFSVRGGDYRKSGTSTPAASRALNGDNLGSFVGFRVVLYKPAENYAPYDAPYLPIGFTHTEGTWNNGYTIRETATGNEFIWVPCVLNQTKVKPGDKVETFKRTIPDTTNTTDPYYRYNVFKFTVTGDNSPAQAIRESVGKYGGFYIAKYEAGVPIDTQGNEINSSLATTTQKARSVSDATAWTGMTRTDAINAASNMINSTSGVKSGLISGESWDTTLQWMVNTSDNAVTNKGYDINSTGKGWYGQTAMTTTGKYPVNNIYDMAGNVWEWTSENCSFDGRNCLVFRGGTYSNSGSDVPAAYRIYRDDVGDVSIGFRVVLYK